MLKFNDYLKEAALSAKQKKIAAVAGDKDKIDSADLTALRAGKKPVEEACSDKDMKKEELVGKQHKLDKNKNGKLDAHDFKLLRKEEAEHEASHMTSADHVYANSDSPGHEDRKAYKEHMKKHFNVTTKFYDSGDTVEYHGSHKDIAATKKHINYLDKHGSVSGFSGHETHDVNESVELRKEAKDGWSKNDSLAKPVTSSQAMADHSKYFNKVTKLDPKTGEPIKKDVKEEAEQIDELSKNTLGNYVKGASKDMMDRDARINNAFNKDPAGGEKGLDKAFNKQSKRTAGFNKAVDKLTKEEVELDEGRVKELAYDLDNMSHDEFHKQYGKPKHYYDPKNFKKPVEPGKGMDRAKALAQRGMQSLSKEEVERIEEKLAQLGEGTYKHEVEKSFPASGVKTGDSAPKGTTYMPKDKEKAKGKPAGSIGEEVEQEMSPYLKGTLKVMDEGKIDNLRDAQKLRQDMQSAYDKDYKPDTSHPHIQVVKGTAYGGENQKDDEGDEKPDETKEKKGRGRPTGSKSGARQKGGGHEDGGIPVHNLNLPKSYK